MNVGTKSLLFGIHQFIWHPVTVVLAWQAIYKRWPAWWELVAIVLHDVGYWGCSDMDGPSGRPHPLKGAALTRKVVLFLSGNYGLARDAHALALGHSRFYAAEAGIPLSKLFIADKMSVLFEPSWFYLLRAQLSRELPEYMENSLFKGQTPLEWLNWYKSVVKDIFWSWRTAP